MEETLVEGAIDGQDLHRLSHRCGAWFHTLLVTRPSSLPLAESSATWSVVTRNPVRACGDLPTAVSAMAFATSRPTHLMQTTSCPFGADSRQRDFGGASLAVSSPDPCSEL